MDGSSFSQLDFEELKLFFKKSSQASNYNKIYYFFCTKKMLLVFAVTFSKEYINRKEQKIVQRIKDIWCLIHLQCHIDMILLYNHHVFFETNNVLSYYTNMLVVNSLDFPPKFEFSNYIWIFGGSITQWYYSYFND